MATFLEPFKFIVRFRLLLARATMTQIRQKNAGTALGQVWLFLSPILFLAIYATVYVMIFRVRTTSMSLAEYVLHIFSGLIPFIAMSEGITSGIPAIESNTTLLKNTVFPIELLPVRYVLATLPGFLIGMGIVLISLALAIGVSIHALLVPFVMILQVMFCVGLVWFLSVFNLIFKDVKMFVGYFITIAMVTSPIAYTIDMIPHELRFLVWLNPFAYFIISYQDLLVAHRMPPLDVGGLMLLISVFVFELGFLVFRKLRPLVISYAG